QFNLTTNSNIQKNNKINFKEMTKLCKIFIVFSILICIFLFPFVNRMTSKFPSAYPGSEASSGVITSEIANQIAVYVWPILIVYLILLVVLIKRKTNYRKVYYPLSFLTLNIIFFNLSIIYSGYMVMWLLIILFYPIIIFLFVLGSIGKKLDNNIISKKKAGTILASLLLMITIVPLCLTFIDFFGTQESSYDNKYEKNKNEIREEFNNLLDNNYISINDFKLSEDNSTIDTIELLITNDNVPNNELDFCNDLIEAYNDIKKLLNKYNYSSEIIDFKFANKNPFAKEGSTFYKESGYIKDCETSYLIYLNPTPVEINK
ncbi:MAG: hypothetical protein K2L98_04055, partial [Bacilli bacterium]|nr:hypothetical protein [Bacilli bacterium]